MPRRNRPEIFTPEVDKFGYPAEMVAPNEGTEDCYLFVEYEAYQDLEKKYEALANLVANAYVLTIAGDKNETPSVDSTGS